MKLLVRLLVVVSIALVIPTAAPAQAQDAIYVTEQAAQAAPAIVNGRILSTTTVQLDGDTRSVSEIEISKSLKGSLQGTVLVEVRGGQLADGRTVFVSHTPQLIVGQQVQVALYETPGALGLNLAAAMGQSNPTYSVVDGAQGAYGLLPDGVGRAQAVSDYVLHSTRWDSFAPPVVFKVNPANSGLSAEATIAAVRRGFQLWEDDPSSTVDFTYGGTTTKTGADFDDGETVVSWIFPDSGPTGGWLAQTAWLPQPDGSMLGFDIRMSRNYFWSDGAAAANRWDIATVVAHEVGHGIGFLHALSTSEIMWSEIKENFVDALGPGDLAGVRTMYPDSNGGPLCNGVPVTVNLATGFGTPTEGNDVILGTDGPDWIWGLGGDDLICAGLGVDRIYGGQGNDTIFGEGGSDHIYGEAGADEIHGGSGADKIYGGPAGDVIFGNGGQDSIWGEDGNDVIQGNWESDKIYGGPGNDDLRGAGGKDKLYGDQGNDALYGGLNTDYLNGGSGTDSGNGQRGRDKPLVPGVSGCEQLAVATSC